MARVHPSLLRQPFPLECLPGRLSGAVLTRKVRIMAAPDRVVEGDPAGRGRFAAHRRSKKPGRGSHRALLGRVTLGHPSSYPRACRDARSAALRCSGGTDVVAGDAVVLPFTPLWPPRESPVPRPRCEPGAEPGPAPTRSRPPHLRLPGRRPAAACAGSPTDGRGPPPFAGRLGPSAPQAKSAAAPGGRARRYAGRTHSR